MKTLSLYIHIPFCKTICLYCNFLTFAHKNRWIPEYIEALRKEIELKAVDYKKYAIETIYFGGGTPSLVEANYIDDILKAIRKNFNVQKKVEINIECNPESIDLEKLKAYKKSGITRISLGIQSFNKKILFRIARPHDSETIFKALSAIKKSPFKNFGADFIIGLPHQTFAEFKKEIAKILTFNIVHLSFYFLSYDTKKIDLFKSDCPSEDIQIKMYEYLTKTLKKNGFIHYEVSNYALPGFECRHNLRYWNQEEYLGLGLGAHSYINKTCTENERNFDEYLKNPLRFNEKIPIDAELHGLEYVMLHLRTNSGIPLSDYEKKFGASLNLLKKAESYIKSRHLKLSKNHLHATEKGFLILDRITRDLL